MKKIGELIMRGRVPVNTNGHKLQLFDGSFKTGYRVTEFRIASYIPYSSEDCVAKLHTSETTTAIGQWDFANNQEIAWATWGSPAGTTEGQSFVDEENMIIQDVYLSNYSQTGDTPEEVNYYIKLEKYEITDWQGALSLVKNKSQA